MRRHEMRRVVRRLGFDIVPGRKHDRVVDPKTRRQVAVMPRGQRAYGHGRSGDELLATLRRHRRAIR